MESFGEKEQDRHVTALNGAKFILPEIIELIKLIQLPEWRQEGTEKRVFISYLLN